MHRVWGGSAGQPRRARCARDLGERLRPVRAPRCAPWLGYVPASPLQRCLCAGWALGACACVRVLPRAFRTSCSDGFVDGSSRLF